MTSNVFGLARSDPNKGRFKISFSPVFVFRIPYFERALYTKVKFEKLLADNLFEENKRRSLAELLSLSVESIKSSMSKQSNQVPTKKSASHFSAQGAANSIIDYKL